MPDTIISVSIKDRYALTEGSPVLVCGNSDYFIKFSFDEEWDAYEAKTARFIYTRAGKVRYQDVVFTGDTVQVPVLSMVQAVQVGVFAGNLRTTTPARIPCRFSVRCGTGEPEEPTPSQYDQIMALLELNGEGKLDKNQGAENAGKALVIGDDGNVIPGKVQSNVQADWEQNDSTAPDYIKWRTHQKMQETNTKNYPAEQIDVEALGTGTHLIFKPANTAYFLNIYQFANMRYGNYLANTGYAFGYDYEHVKPSNGWYSGVKTISPESLMTNTLYNLIDSTNYSFPGIIGTVYVILDVNTLAEDRKALFPEIGIYLEVPEDSTKTDRKFTLKVFRVLKLSEMYIPDTFARKTDIPSAVETALAEAKESGDFKGAPGDDYVLTEADKNEIAEIAAGLVDVPEGGGGSSGSEWTKLGDVTVSGTYEFNILSIDGGVVTLDTNAEWYSYMNGNRNVIVHAIDISATNVSSHLLKLRPKDYSAGTFDVYNMDEVKQSSVAFNTTQYKISVQNINKVVMTGIPQYDKYKMRAFFPVIQPHGLRPIFGCNVSRLGFGESDPTGHGPSIFEKELFTFPYNPNYMVEKASITFGVLYPVNPDTMHNAVTIVKAGENQTRPKNDTIEFSPYFCPFVNGTRFEVWGANDV